MPPAGPTPAMRARSAVPDRLVPTVVRARIKLKKRKDGPLQKARQEMGFLLGAARPDDVERAARAYLERDVWRSELRYHPEIIGHQLVENLDALVRARQRGRGVVVSFLHHGHYEGACAALGYADQPLNVVVSPDMLAENAPTFLRQHVIAGTVSGSRTVDAAIGGAKLGAMLADGQVLAVATDVPGQSRLQFLGRERLGSSGAARLATATRSPVVTMSAHCETDGTLWLSLGDPIDPGDFDSAEALVQHLVAVQEEAVLAWPEGYHQPRLRWGSLEEDAETPAT